MAKERAESTKIKVVLRFPLCSRMYSVSCSTVHHSHGVEIEPRVVIDLLEVCAFCGPLGFHPESVRRSLLQESKTHHRELTPTGSVFSSPLIVIPYKAPYDIPEDEGESPRRVHGACQAPRIARPDPWVSSTSPLRPEAGVSRRPFNEAFSRDLEATAPASPTPPGPELWLFAFLR